MLILFPCMMHWWPPDKDFCPVRALFISQCMNKIMQSSVLLTTGCGLCCCCNHPLTYIIILVSGSHQSFPIKRRKQLVQDFFFNGKNWWFQLLFLFFPMTSIAITSSWYSVQNNLAGGVSKEHNVVKQKSDLLHSPLALAPSLAPLEITLNDICYHQDNLCQVRDKTADSGLPVGRRWRNCRDILLA